MLTVPTRSSRLPSALHVSENRVPNAVTRAASPLPTCVGRSSSRSISTPTDAHSQSLRRAPIAPLSAMRHREMLGLVSAASLPWALSPAVLATSSRLAAPNQAPGLARFLQCRAQAESGTGVLSLASQAAHWGPAVRTTHRSLSGVSVHCPLSGLGAHRALLASSHNTLCLVGAPATASPHTSATSTTVSAHKPKDMYADLARYGIMDEFDMAPMPFLNSTPSTLAPPPQGAPLGSPILLPKGPPGRPRRTVSNPPEAPWGKDPGQGSAPEAAEGAGEETGLRSEIAGSHAGMHGDLSAGKGGSALPGLEEAAAGTWCVYLLLAADDKKTYVGVTNDVERRLKQHNGEIVGGAKTTKAGRPWTLLCFVSGFQTRSEAFQFEWRWKNPRAIKGDGSFDRGSMAPSAQLLRDREAATAGPGSQAASRPHVVERRRASLEEALRTFPKWRYLQVNWSDSMR